MLNSILILVLVTIVMVADAQLPYRPKTVSGVLCQIPFKYQEKSYEDCTTEGGGKPWCYTKGFDWEYCDTAPDFSKCDVAPSKTNTSEVELIVQFLNNMRSNEPATRMAKIKWNSELAMRSQFMSDRCELGNSNSKLCSSPSYMGQISYMTMSSSIQDSQWMEFLLDFYNKKSGYDLETNKCNIQYCNGYKQLVNANTMFVGCARSSCKKDSMNADYYFCNFHPPIYSGAPYEKGTERCQSCYKLDESQSFRCDNNLCEMCDVKTAECQGKEQLIKEIASGKVCDDVSPSYCSSRVSMCQYLNILPTNQKELMLTQCKKTCKLC